MLKATATKKRIYPLLPFLLLAVLPWILYGNTLSNNFVFDDLPLIKGNKTLSSVKSLGDINSLFAGKHHYRPIRTLSYLLDYQLSGSNPISYHLSNILYHTITVLFIYLATLILIPKRTTALCAALLFAVHPIHTDSVTYMAGRRDILCGLFFFMGFYCFLRYRRSGRLLPALCAVLAYLLSIGSKEMGVTLPVIFLIFDTVNTFSPEGDFPRLHPLKEVIAALKKTAWRYRYFYGTFFAGALSFSCYKVFISSPSHQKGYYGDSMVITFLTVSRIIVHYLKLLTLPVKLVADYSYDAFPLSSTPFEWSTFSSLLLLAVLCFFLFKTLILNKWLAFGGFWFPVTLLPVCQIIPHHELLAEHYLYLPAYGFCLTVSLAITPLLHHQRYALFTRAAFIVLLAFLSLRTIDRNRDWENGMTLWSATVTTVPRCARAQNNLGVQYLQNRNIGEAVNHLSAALTIKPDYAEAYNNMGLAYREQGMYDRAITQFSKALRIKKHYLEPLYNLADIFEKKGEYDRSILLYKTYLRRKPQSAQVHNNLGIVYQQQGRLELAGQQYLEAVRLDPDNLEARNNLGAWYYSSGKYDQAITEFRKILTESPDNAEAHCNLGTAYNSKGLYDRAIEEFREALRIRPQFLEAVNNLGNAYKGKGQYDEAIDAFSKALEMNQYLAIPHLNLAVIYLYKKKDAKRALYHFERALEIDPGFPQAESIRNQITLLKRNGPQYPPR